MSDLASLCEGETLMIGGKEAEVMGVVAPEDFAKGRCFQDFQSAKPEPQTKSAGSVSKPFCPPTSLRGDRLGSRPEAEEQTCKPRHDPAAPGSCTFLFHLIPNLSQQMHETWTCDSVVRCAGDASPLSYTPVVPQQVWASCGGCGCGPSPERPPASTPEGRPGLPL